MHEHGAQGDSVWDIATHSISISLFVFLMMMLVDYLNIWSEGKFTTSIQKGKSRQYLLAAGLGIIPGCLGSFLAVALYIRGMLGFGALVGNFVATTGDSAFVLLAELPRVALVVFGILFAASLFAAAIGDWLARRIGFIPQAQCQTDDHHLAESGCVIWPGAGWWEPLRKPHPLRIGYVLVLLASAGLVLTGRFGPDSWNWVRVASLALISVGLFVVLTEPDHYLIEHIGQHITLKHLPWVFAWTLGSLILLGMLQHYVDLKELVSANQKWFLVAAALIGIIPDTGPQLLFIFLFKDSMIPFSVLLTNALAQSGHAMLPLLSVCIKDSVLAKAVNLLIALLIGFSALALGY